MKKAGGVLAVIGALFVLLTFRMGIAYMRPHVDLYAKETNVNDIGFFDMVETDVWIVIDCFASETTTENGAETGKDYYYIIPVQNGDEIYYIGAKVTEKDSYTYDDIIRITEDAFMGYSDDLGSKTVKLTGLLSKMNKEEKKYFYEYFENDEELKTYALPLYIENVAKPSAEFTMMLVGAAVLAVGIVLLVIGIVRDKKKDKKSADQTHVVINGVTYPKSTFNHVNQCINSQEKAFAAQELHEITGVSLDEAGNIIANWSKYYY